MATAKKSRMCPSMIWVGRWWTGTFHFAALAVAPLFVTASWLTFFVMLHEIGGQPARSKCQKWTELKWSGLCLQISARFLGRMGARGGKVCVHVQQGNVCVWHFWQATNLLFFESVCTFYRGTFWLIYIIWQFLPAALARRRPTSRFSSSVKFKKFKID